MSIAEVMMNPSRLRILQYLIANGTGTTAQIRAELNDIPQASLYRHIKILLDSGYIEISNEKRLRGTVEKTYRLSTPKEGAESVEKAVEGCILSLLSSFHEYFSKADNSPEKDLLMVRTLTLMLSDEEFTELLVKIGELFGEAMKNKAEDGRKPRRLTVISSPCEK